MYIRSYTDIRTDTFIYDQYVQILTIHTDTIIYVTSLYLMLLIRTYTFIYMYILSYTIYVVYVSILFMKCVFLSKIRTNTCKYLQNVHQQKNIWFWNLKKVYVFGMVLLVYCSIFVRILFVYCRFARIC